MPPNSEHARKRLRLAALELFAENGFDQTTTAQIAGRAGLTERTFFRHFPDKREVLFEGQEILSTALSEAIMAAPAELSPMQTLHLACASVTKLLEDNRPFSEPRQHIIAASPALLEREVAKHAALGRSVAGALQRRGVEPLQAGFAAQIGLAVLSHAIALWFADASLLLSDCIERAFAELQMFAAPAKSS